MWWYRRGGEAGASCAMRSSPFPLVALRQATASQRAGVVPSCAIAVRVLDRIDLVVHAGDCVVVRHDSPASASVLVGLLCGDLAAGHREGQRHAVQRLRVRRTAISDVAMPWLLDGWRSVSGSSAAPLAAPPSAPVIHVLRASRTSTATTAGSRSVREAETWRQWGQTLREGGGAIVILAEDRLGGIPTRAGPARPLFPTALVRESGRDTWSTAGAIRHFHLHQGRLSATRP